MTALLWTWVILRGLGQVLYWIGYAVFWAMALLLKVLWLCVLAALVVIAWPIALVLR